MTIRTEPEPDLLASRLAYLTVGITHSRNDRRPRSMRSFDGLWLSDVLTVRRSCT